MHCPQCGRSFSSEVSYCKSCGLSLESTKKLFSPDDASPSHIEKWIELLRRSRGRRGVYRGMIIIAFGIGFMAFMGSGGNNNIYAFIILTAGLLRIFYAMFFQEVVSRKAQGKLQADHASPVKRRDVKPAAPTNALPSAHFVPAPNIGTVKDTAELIEVPSVTENTTNLLTDRMTKAG